MFLERLPLHIFTYQLTLRYGSTFYPLHTSWFLSDPHKTQLCKQKLLRTAFLEAGEWKEAEADDYI